MLQQGNISPEDVIPPTKKYIKKIKPRIYFGK